MCQFWFWENEGEILLEKYKNLSHLSCEFHSRFINNVSSSIEKSLILHPGASYKEKYRCKEPGEGSWGQSMGGGLDLRNGLLTIICCFLKKKGERWCQLVQGKILFFSLIQDFIKPGSALSCNPSSMQRDISTGLLHGDLSRNSRACHIEKLKRRVLTAEILVEV